MTRRIPHYQQYILDDLRRRGLSPTGRTITMELPQGIGKGVPYTQPEWTEPPSKFEANYADLELRLLMQSPDVLRTMITHGYDLHRARAAQHYGVAYEDVTPDQREAGKQLNMLDLYKP